MIITVQDLPCNLLLEESWQRPGLNLSFHGVMTCANRYPFEMLAFVSHIPIRSSNSRTPPAVSAAT
jgi:hypothetical protein